MTNEQAPSNASDRLVVSADIAYQKAGEFVWHLGNLAEWARLRVPAAKNLPKGAPPHPPPDRQLQGETFARAFLSCFDLEPLLTEDLRSAARRVHSVDAGPIRFGELEPALSVIEAVAHGLSTTFRNSVYGGRRHPLEPDFDRVADEAEARAIARQIARGKPARPVGWEKDYDRLWPQETRAAVRERLGIRNDNDALDFMVREWNVLDADEALTAVSRLRFTGIDFDDLRMRLMREAGTVVEEASKWKDRRFEKPPKLPKTRRGFQRLAETTTRDQPIIAAIKEGKSYRQVASECKVGKTTVERVAKAYGLTGHAPETVPLDGTFQENLSIRGKPGKRGSK